MKKTLFIIIFLFIISLFIDIPDYVELNNLVIVDEVYCKDNNIYIKEIIPIKDNNGISYKYKKYKIKLNDKENILKDIETSINKKAHFKDKDIIKNLTNC